MVDIITNRIKESIETKEKLLDSDIIVNHISLASERMIFTLKRGGKLVLCGNGGSASDAMHFAGELVGRFQRERKSLPAIVLNSDPVAMSSIANDFDYSEVFSRQVDAFIHEKDILIGISTSGNSENVIKAVEAAKRKRAYTIGLLGHEGGKIGDMADNSIIIPSNVTARIQESHILIIHIMCELIEEAIFNAKP